MNAAPDTDAIAWPAHYAPSRSPIHVRNELRIAAPLPVVWSWLTRAEQWPRWYSNSANVRFVSGDGPDLTEGAQFRWKTFGVSLVSCVKEFVPQSRLAWDAKTFGIEAYHAWLLRPTPDGGCHVLTEETQHGVIARAGQLLFPNRMQRYHQIWLESLASCAARGMPARRPDPDKSKR